MEVEAGGPPPESVGWGGFEEVQVGVAIPATGEKISFALGRTAGKPRVQQRRREAVSDGTLPQLPSHAQKSFLIIPPTDKPSGRFSLLVLIAFLFPPALVQSANTHAPGDGVG